MTFDRPQPPTLDRRVSVQVAMSRSRVTVAGRPPLVVLGVVAPDAPWLNPLLPEAAVRGTRFGSRDGAVELLAWGPGAALGLLPGLDPRAPSRVRDAVALALAAGAPEVHTMLVRGADLRHPWDLDQPALLDLAGPFLDDLPGAILALPDADGPAPLAPLEGEPLQLRVDRLGRTLQAHGPGLAERYQVALVDAPAGAGLPAEGADAGLCTWEGEPGALARHGWRSAAAAVAGRLATLEPFTGLLGQTLNLGPGRRPSRAPLDQPPAEAPRGPLTRLRLHGTRDEATFVDDLSLRSPLGDWSLPALRTLKAIHRAVVMAAERSVFSRLEQQAAFTLALAINQAVSPFVAAGLLVGPDGEGGPEVDGDVVRDPQAPALVATLSGQVRPWCRAIRVRVRVSDGASPQLEGDTP